MGQVLIRDLDEAMLKDYRRAAAANGRSLEAELRIALLQARPVVRVATGSDLRALTEKLWAGTPASSAEVDSTPIIRAFRDA